MELVHELFLSASLALLLSFLVAKLVSMAMASDANREVEMNLALFAEKLAVQGFGSEKKVESVVRSAETIDKFLGEQSDVGPTVENVSFRGEFQEKQSESLETSSCDRLGENFECDALPKNILEGPIFSEMVVENSSNSNAEGYKEPNVDDIGDQMRHNAMAEEIREEEQNDVLQSPTVEADKEQNDVLQSPTVEADNEEDDDDWEGIERTELENVFAAASRFVSEEDGLENAGNELEMKFYGLHKVATEGPCRESQPMALKVSARAKWNAWQKLGNMSPEVAMEQYITLLSDRAPGWMEHSTTGCSKPESLETGEAEYLLHQPNGRKLAELDSGGNRGAIAANYH